MISPFHFLRLDGLTAIFILVFILILSDTFLKIKLNKTFFYLIMVNLFLRNVTSLIPFMYCLSSYMWSRLVISIRWVLFIFIFKIFVNCDKFLIHLLPINRPIILWDFLIILEILRNLIRPLTLSLRLTCNLITGHVLIRLAIICNSSLVLLGLLFFEIIIRLIQSQVFSILSQSYLMD